MASTVKNYMIPISRVLSSQLNNVSFFPSRYEAIKNFSAGIYKDKKINILEIGVLAGDFADYLIDTLSINELVLLDPYNVIDFDPSYKDNPRFYPHNHLEYIKNKYENNELVKIVKGYSYDTLYKMLSLPKEKKFDFIYIDASHKYGETLLELLLSSMLLKNFNGLIGIDDVDDEISEALLDFLENNRDWNIVGWSFGPKNTYNAFISKLQAL